MWHKVMFRVSTYTRKCVKFSNSIFISISVLTLILLLNNLREDEDISQKLDTDLDLHIG